MNKWNELSMADRAKYIMLAVHNGITDLNTIRHTYNSLSEGGPYSAGKMTNTLYDRGVKSGITDLGVIRNKPSNKYSGTSTPTQQMNRARVNYYDPITGENYGSTMPSGKVRVNSFSDLTPMAQDEYRRNHPTLLDEVIIYPKSGKGAKSTGMGSYYDDISTMTDANIEHTAKVREADSRVKETAAFEKPLNFLSPGQWFGAGINYLQGESPLWSGIYNGNSGWVPDNFARENPRASLLLNMLGDSAFDFSLPYMKKGITTGFNKGMEGLGYYKDFKPNENNFYRVVGRDAVDDAISSGKIRAKTGWYHGALNDVLKKWGEYFNDFTIDELRRMDPGEAAGILKERMGEAYEKLPGSEKFKLKLHFRTSTNHGGTVGFVKGGTFYKPTLDDVIIEGTPKSAKYAKGHHGAVYYDAPIKTGDAVVMLDENTGLNKNASTTLNDGFSYYEREPLLDLPYFRNNLYWKHKKFKTKK